MRLRVIIILASVLLVLGIIFFVSRWLKPGPRPEEPRVFIWSVEMKELKAIVIRLPQEGKSEAWVKHEDQYWYFDRPNGPKVNMKRWGGGIPLLLSGPGAERPIANNATSEELKKYRLNDPRMNIDLTLENKDTINIVVGDSTPDGQAYYIKLVQSKDVFTVHYTWYEVLERLVLEPPYP